MAVCRVFNQDDVLFGAREYIEGGFADLRAHGPVTPHPLTSTDSRVQVIPYSLATPPEKVCLLRLSAIGDTCHVVPLLRTLQDAWPRTRFTWVIGKLEAKLMSLIPDV